MSGIGKMVVLSGGTGTPKLMTGMDKVKCDESFTVIGNTGDDWKFYGLHISPDLDSVIFSLSNLIDTKKWWGIRGDSFNLVDTLKSSLKEKIWFNLGDKDTAISLYRTYLMREKGNSLTQATDKTRNRLGIRHQILPMSDQPVETRVVTKGGDIHLQEFWIQKKGLPEVLNVYFKMDNAFPTSEVIQALEIAHLTILGPSNPVSSIGPILALPDVKETLRANQGSKVAVSPIIGSNPVSGPTGNFLRAWGIEVTPYGIANLYKDLVDIFFLHKTDSKFQQGIQDLDIETVITDIIFRDNESAVRLSKEILETCA